MTDPSQTADPPPMAPHRAAAGFVEKTPLERYVPPAKPSLVGLSRVQLAEALGTVGVPAAQGKMRAQQIWHWLYVRGATRFDEMSSVSKELRAVLDRHFTLARPEVVAEQVSVDGTRKWLLRLPGEHAGEQPHEVECVYIPEAGRGTLCVSSQVGCTLTCSFCHTGTQRLVRNLTPGEIVGQIMVARDRLGDWLGTRGADGGTGDRLVSNIVMMGMGEPLYNFEAERGSRFPSAASRSRPPASCRTSRAPAPRSAACSRFRCMRCATSCATTSYRSIANIRSRNCSTPAAPIPAPPMRGASLSNT
jgi:hypothetical protein